MILILRASSLVAYSDCNCKSHEAFSTLYSLLSSETKAKGASSLPSDSGNTKTRPASTLIYIHQEFSYIKIQYPVGEQPPCSADYILRWPSQRPSTRQRQHRSTVFTIIKICKASTKHISAQAPVNQESRRVPSAYTHTYSTHDTQMNVLPGCP